MSTTTIGSIRVYTEILRTPFTMTPTALSIEPYGGSGWPGILAEQSVAHSQSVSSWLRHLEDTGSEFLGMTGGLRQGEDEHCRWGEWWTVLVHGGSE